MGVLFRLIVIREAPELGRNVCIVEKETIQITLRRKISSSIKDIVKDCGVETRPKIDCEQRK